MRSTKLNISQKTAAARLSLLRGPIAFAGAEAELDDRQGVGTRIWHTDPGGCKSIFGCIQNLLPHFPGLPTG